jgi:hypothetical protein
MSGEGWSRGTPSCKSKIRVDETKKQEQANRDVMSAFEDS